MKNKIFSRIIINIIILQGIISNFPEDYSGIEKLTYTNNENEEEIFLNSYYFSQSSSSIPKNDFRNGIKIIPINIDTATGEDDSNCDYSSGLGLANDDDEWDFNDNNNANNRAFYPPSLKLITSCIKSGIIELDLKPYIEPYIIDEYDLSYIFYFWLEKIDGITNTIEFRCKGTYTGVPIIFSSAEGFCQFYLKYNYLQNRFSDKEDNYYFSCDSEEEKMFITISNSNSDIILNRIKVSLLLKREKISSLNCNVVQKCHYSYYCEVESG